MLDDIFSSIIGTSCGLCCSQPTPCEKCLHGILMANGLKLSLVNQIRGFKHKAPNHGNGFQFSEMYSKIVELNKNPDNFQTEDYS